MTEATTTFYYKNDKVYAHKDSWGVHIGLGEVDEKYKREGLKLICFQDRDVWFNYYAAVVQAGLEMDRKENSKGIGRLVSWVVMKNGVPEISEVKAVTVEDIFSYYTIKYPNAKIDISQKIYATEEDS